MLSPLVSKTVIQSIDIPAAFEAAAIAVALRAYAAEQLAAIEGYLVRRGNTFYDGIHETRKAIRRFRAAFALCGATERPAAALDQAARRLGKSLSKLRDAHVTVQLSAKRLKGHHTNDSKADPP
jgi:CHAD domain-containing protein